MAAPRRVHAHLPWTALVVPALLAVCVMPLASAGGAFSVVYVLPAVALLVVIYAGTTATGSHLSARWLTGRTRLAWDDVYQLEFPPHRWAVAVTQSGRRVVLPGVRPADLPRIVSTSGGRLFLRRPAEQQPAPSEEHVGDDGAPVGDDGAPVSDDVEGRRDAPASVAGASTARSESTASPATTPE